MKFKCLHLLDTNILKKYWLLKHKKNLFDLVCSKCSSQNDIKICLTCNKVFCKNDFCVHTIFYINKNFKIKCYQIECIKKKPSSQKNIVVESMFKIEDLNCAKSENENQNFEKNKDYKSNLKGKLKLKSKKYHLNYIKIPKQFEIVSNIIIGLPNLGNTCYANSLLQLLINNKQLRTKLFKIEKCSIPCSICEIKNLTESYLNKSALNISKLMTFLMKNNSEYLNCEQHDVYLLYLYLFDDNLVKNHKKLISSLFINEGKNIVECINCKNKTIIRENFKVLSLDYNFNLKTSINQYFSKEKLNDGWNCQMCSKSVCLKYVQLFVNSKILTIQIKRFKNEHDRVFKINEDMEIEDIIEICGNKYVLYGFIVHIGKINFGHYVSYMVKDEYYIKFDDELVSKEYQKNVLKKAYLLFFCKL